MDLTILIITPVSGAVIGYFTNWIAIKMLFRPHEEKRVFGKRLPFTPGLIPKERYELSKKVGQTLGTHVLTADTIMETVLKNEQALDNILNRYIDKIKKNPHTIADIVKTLPNGGGDFEPFKAQIEDYLIKTITSADTIDRITDFLCDIAIRLSKSESAGLLATNLLDTLKPVLLEQTERYFKSGAFETFISEAAGGLFEKLGYMRENVYLDSGGNGGSFDGGGVGSDGEGFDGSGIGSGGRAADCIDDNDKQKTAERTIAEILPVSMVDTLKKLIKDKLPGLADTIKNLPYNNPTVDAALRGLVNKVIDDNLGYVAGMFVNKDKIYSNMRFAVFEYLTYRENVEVICNKAEELIDKFLARRLSYYLKMLPSDANEHLQKRITDFISEAIDYGFIEKVLLYIYTNAAGFLSGKNHESIYEMLKGFSPGFDESLKEYIKPRVGAYISENAHKLICGDKATGNQGLLVMFVNYIGKYRIDLFITNMETEKLDKAKNTLISLTKLLLEKGIKALFEGVDIAKIVEDQINKFDTQTAEDIIISVVKRELRAITILGGLMGFVLGLMSAMLSVIGR